MGIEQLFALAVQAAVVLVPLIWRLSAVATKVAAIEQRLGNGHGIPTVCAVHGDRIDDHEERIERLEQAE